MRVLDSDGVTNTVSVSDISQITSGLTMPKLYAATFMYKHIPIYQHYVDHQVAMKFHVGMSLAHHLSQVALHICK